MNYATDEINRFTILVINDSIKNNVINEIDDNDLFEVVRNNNGEIQLVSYNTKNVNKLLALITSSITENFNLLENGEYIKTNLSNDFFRLYDDNLLESGIICKIPFGAFWNNSLLSNVGPKIPVKFNIIGNISSSIETNIKEYGINNALLEVNVKVKVNTRVNLPFISDMITVTSSVPISIKVIQGTIPDYYLGGLRSTFGDY